jgi:hypothetical protein
MDIAGTTKPKAAVYCIVKPHKSKAIVAILANIVVQKPHFRFAKRPKAAVNPQIPRKRNIVNITRDVSYDISTSKNCPIPSGLPMAANESLPMDWISHKMQIRIIPLLFAMVYQPFSS